MEADHLTTDYSNRSSDAKTVVKTRSGTVVGQVCTSIYNDQYVSFECIPYAQPPLGTLRFKAPIPVNRWKKTLYCHQKGEKPLQFNRVTKTLEGVENCLYLNVYVKSVSSEYLILIMRGFLPKMISSFIADNPG